MPSKRPKLLDPVKTDRLRRTIRAYNSVNLQYIPNKKEDKAELETSLYKQKYPEQVERQLIKILRVKVPRGSFELDPEGTVDEKGTVTEALVYTVQEQVVNPNPDVDKEEQGVYAWCSEKHGIYKKPIANVKKDDLGNPISSKVIGAKAMFYIKFEPDTVKKILAEFDGESSQGFGLAVARRESAEDWYGGQTYTVYNLDEFCYSNFDDVLGANQMGFLKNKATGIPVSEGGVNKYIMDKAARREQAEREYRLFREKQKGHGTTSKNIK